MTAPASSPEPLRPTEEQVEECAEGAAPLPYGFSKYPGECALVRYAPMNDGADWYKRRDADRYIDSLKAIIEKLRTRIAALVVPAQTGLAEGLEMAAKICEEVTQPPFTNYYATHHIALAATTDIKMRILALAAKHPQQEPDKGGMVRDAARYRYCRDNGMLDGHVDAYEEEHGLDESSLQSQEYRDHCDEAIDAMLATATPQDADGAGK